LAESLFEMVPNPDPEKGQPKSIKRQTKHAAIIVVDEGQAATAIAGQQNSTLFATLRSAWFGMTLGNANAKIETRRIVPAGSYVFGLVMGLQPELAGPLLEDVAAGTPQRFLWTSATDPTLPRHPPAWPGPLPWERPMPPAYGPMGEAVAEVTFHEAIVDEVQEQRHAVATGRTVLSPDDGHRNLLRLKVAALLAILAGRLDVNLDDWRLASVMVDTSDAVREDARRAVAAKRREKLADRDEVEARKAVHVGQAVEHAQAERTLARIGEQVRANGTRDGGIVWWFKGTAMRRLSGPQRQVVPDAERLGAEYDLLLVGTTAGDNGRTVDIYKWKVD
jgi:hypothetical protein